MKFSIICPTRRRPNLIVLFVESIIKTTKNMKDIEIQLITDEDDIIAKNAVLSLKDKYPKYDNE
ncbi:unnamed protein product, partial [marine sediment metagenome]